VCAATAGHRVVAAQTGERVIVKALYAADFTKTDAFAETMAAAPWWGGGEDRVLLPCTVHPLPRAFWNTLKLTLELTLGPWPAPHTRQGTPCPLCIVS
jgi:hypothetical protein